MLTNTFEIPENGINYYTKRIEYRAHQSKPESKHAKYTNTNPKTISDWVSKGYVKNT